MINDADHNYRSATETSKSSSTVLWEQPLNVFPVWVASRYILWQNALHCRRLVHAVLCVLPISRVVDRTPYRIPSPRWTGKQLSCGPDLKDYNTVSYLRSVKSIGVVSRSYIDTVGWNNCNQYPTNLCENRKGNGSLIGNRHTHGFGRRRRTFCATLL
jgi:hypothetical protein